MFCRWLGWCAFCWNVPCSHKIFRVVGCPIWVFLGVLVCQQQAFAGEEGVRYDWFVWPLMGYNSDNGLGFGLRAELAEKEPAYDPHHKAYMIQGYASLRQFHYHMLRYDHLGFLGIEGLRLTINGVYRQWGNDGYWGIGNSTARERAYVGPFEDGDPRAKHYLYKLAQPFLHTTLRMALLDDWSAFVSIIGKWSDIESFADSLLQQEQPLGFEGGFNMQLSGGVVYDTRKPEVDPTQGVFAETSLSAALETPWGPGWFVGLFASIRAYIGLTDWATLCMRAMTEMLFGDVPFYEMVHWHGSVPIAGFGGGEAVRGYRFGRFRAPHRLVSSVELRFSLWRMSFYNRPLVLQLGVYSDAGFVWGAESAANGADFVMPVHLSAGTGLRLVFAESFVARLDTGFASDPIREATGELTSDLSFGLYLTFGQAF